MKQSGFSVTVYEIGSQVGGMWWHENDNGLSSAYRTLHINTSRNVTRFPDLDFETDVQPFPDHRDMHRYLRRYADHFAVTELIRFNTTVTRVEPLFTPGTEKPRWRVVTSNGDSEVYDSVIVASGHLHVPRHVPELQAFSGQYLHAHNYNAPEPFVNQRICIVGVGNSACDIAGDVCVNSQSCVMVARSGVLILPKLIFGRPFTDLSSALQRPWAYRRIQVKQGIKNIDGKRITFIDGTSKEFDVLIAATGYLTELPFLDPEIVSVNDNVMDLYQRIVPPDWPGLYLLGFFNTDTALNWIFNHQAKWVAEIELGNARLPDTNEMRIAIRNRRDWLKEHYRDTPRHSLEEESVPYVQSLQRSLTQMRKLAGADLRHWSSR